MLEFVNSNYLSIDPEAAENTTKHSRGIGSVLSELGQFKAPADSSIVSGDQRVERAIWEADIYMGLYSDQYRHSGGRFQRMKSFNNNK